MPETSAPPLEAVTTELRVLLTRAGLRGDALDDVVRDAAWRMVAFANALRDGVFEPATATVLEEATHYSPRHLPLDVRLFVAGAVRNSLLESFHADPINRPDDHHMRSVTSGMAKAVHRIGLIALVKESRSISYWTNLATRFPASWRALDTWSRLREGGAVTADRMAVGELVDLPRTRGDATSGGYTVANGIDPTIDIRLASVLDELKSNRLEFLFVPSFKHLTRNIEKFLAVLEHILATGGCLLTLNALLRNGYVARRRHLLRPAHSDEWRGDLTRDGGLAEEHLKALTLLR